MRAFRPWFVSIALMLAVPSNDANAQNRAAILSDKPPRFLSEYGFFKGPGIDQPLAGVIAYDLATPLFSDHALKMRHVHVPPGAAARYDENEAFEFPVGTALIKTFAYPSDFRSPEKNIRLIETRVLLRQESGWQAMAYVWNEEQDEAELKIAGKRLPVSFIDGEGGTVSFSYAVPSKNQCKTCHSFNEDVVPIGPKARNLNRDFDHGEGPANQLAYWAAAGLLEGAPALAETPRAADWTDQSASLEARARTWLDVNCAHCHRQEGSASNSGLFLTYGEEAGVTLGIGKRPVAAGRGAGGNEFDIVPGHPERSILLSRVESVEPGIMMPELGRSLRDAAAVKLLSEWISALR